MTPFTIQELQPLLAPHAAPCISIFLPTHRRYPEAEQDPIRFKNLLGTAEGLLRERYAPKDIRALLDPLGGTVEPRFLAILEGIIKQGFLASSDGWTRGIPVPRLHCVLSDPHAPLRGGSGR